MFKKIISICSLIFTLTNLTGCAGMNGQFGCNEKAGRGCTPVYEVNKRADSGMYAFGEGASHSSVNGKAQVINNEGSNYALNGQPLRHKESVQHIWIAPFEDKDGVYHQASSIFVVLKKSHWDGLPPSVIDHEGDVS